MKALFKTKYGPDCMELMDVPEPIPNDDEIKVKIAACGVCGTDIHLLHDAYASNPPLITGHEFSGIVCQVGKNVTDFAVGDRVVSMSAVDTCDQCDYCLQGRRMLCPDRRSIGTTGRGGGFAEYTVLPTKTTFRLPDSVSLITAALCEPLACICRGVCERTDLKPGDYVLVAGAGAMGQLTAQVAMASGAVVIMTGLKADAERFALAKKSGVFATVCVDEGDPVAKILELTHGQGPRVAFECSGVAASTDLCLRALKKDGRYTQISIPGKPIPFNMDMALYKEILISNSYASERSSWKLALRLLDEKLVQIDDLIGPILSLDQWEEGFELTSQKKAYKVVLMPHLEELESYR